VYIWFDRKSKRYYIGSHWGREDDGYVCSSKWMRRTYKRRPSDFKRRVLTRDIIDRKETIIQENKWLSLIDSNELGKKYYNLQNHQFNHWTDDKVKLLSVGEKISASHRADPNWGKWALNKTVSAETREKIRAAAIKQFSDPNNIVILSEKIRKLWQDPEYRKTQINKKIGKKQSIEHVTNRMSAMKLTNATVETREKRKAISNRQSNLDHIHKLGTVKHKCDYCDFIGNSGHLKRWHNQNCKNKSLL
jgi:hypothetical protein